MKLEGLRVLDLGMFLPIPVITQMMADHGADVIAVEPPGGQVSRVQAGMGPNGEPLWFNAMHRGKRSIMLNLKAPGDHKTLLALVAEADVFIESFRPGVAARLGIDSATLRAHNPRLVYCSLSAFGQTGPLSLRPGHDMVGQSYAGLASLNAAPGQLPISPGAPTADMVSGLTAFSAILMALYRRHTTGLGDTIDISMLDSLLAYTPHYLSFVQADREGAPRQLAEAVSGWAFYNVYVTRDGKRLALAGMEPHYVRAFLAAVEREDLLEATLGGPGPAQEQVKLELAALFATRDLADWNTLLEAIAISWAPILDMVEAFDHPHARAREMVLPDGEGGLMLGTPLKFTDEPGIVGRAPPALDEHRAAILREGFGPAQPHRKINGKG
jgi:crotonobetainyl-CoA:carnitine CoA-transferase CaiB-like acyl-CoA transferase